LIKIRYENTTLIEFSDEEECIRVYADIARIEMVKERKVVSAGVSYNIRGLLLKNFLDFMNSLFIESMGVNKIRFCYALAEETSYPHRWTIEHSIDSKFMYGYRLYTEITDYGQEKMSEILARDFFMLGSMKKNLVYTNYGPFEVDNSNVFSVQDELSAARILKETRVNQKGV